MSSTYDAVVVGGGHNGLVSAAYLARAGARTLVLEGRHKTGGAATTETPWPEAPEFKVTRLSYVMSLLPPTVMEELELVRHGYKIFPMGPYYQAFPEGGSIKIFADDAKRNHEEIAKWSKKDADAMPRWDAWMAGLADVLGPLLLTVPPKIGSHRPADLLDTLRLAWRNRGLDVRTIADVTRLMTMSIADLLDDWFESSQVKGAMAVNGVIGTWAGPWEPGTAYVMAHHSIGDIGDGHLGNWGFQEGGMGGVADAIERSARSFGAEIRLNAPVEKVHTAAGKVRGVVLQSGEEISAPIVVTTLHPRTAFLDHLDRGELPDTFVQDIERWKTRSGVVKINLALSELPDFLADPGTDLQEHHTGSVEMAPSMEYIERAFQDAREGRPALRPFSDGVIPSSLDKTLCPEGTHIMSLFSQWVPLSFAEAPHREELEAYADRMVDCYTETAPNFKSSIIHRDVVGPYEMEHDYGLIGGNIFHGELSAEQLFHMRPAAGFADYRTPVHGLYYGKLGHARRRRGLRHPRVAGGTSCHSRPPARPTPALAWRHLELGVIETSGHASEHASGPDARSHAAAAGAVRAMLEAKSVALLGASPRPGSLGERMVMEATRSSAQPEIHLVNPRYARMFGRPCLPSIDSIEGPVDLVLLGVPDGALEDQLSRAAARGDRSAVIFSGAFNGSGTEALRDRLATQARGAGMALCGAGCMGFVNVAYGLRALGYIERDPLPNGPVALITHSGSVFSALLRSRRDLGFTLAVSSGQELVTTTADYLEYALSQPATRVVALLLETLRDPSAFRRALDRAARQDVVVVALTVGGSPGGRTMVAAHSGSLAGEDGAWAALFEAHGVIRVADLDEMADTLELFSSPRRAGPTGPQGGIATVHDSGAERALVADMAHRLEVPFATIGEETARRIRELLDPGLEPANPLDLWGNGRDTERLFTDALTAMADDDNVAVVALGVDMVPEYDGDDSYPLAAFEVARRTRKPFAVLNNVASSLDNDAASALRAEGVTVLEGTGSGLLALHHLLEYRDQRSRSLVPSGAHLNQARRTSWLDRLSRGPLSAIDSFALLADYGITPVAAREVASADDAVAAARDFGYPVVLKTADPAHSHKTEVDGVKLGLDDDDMVAAAFLELTRRLGPRVLVASGAPPGVELVVGLARDPLVGPLVVVGAGGVLVELLADRTLGLPPIDAARAARMIDGLRMRPLLDGYRGGVPVDFDAVVGAVVGLSNLAEELGDAIDALDVNPLRCGPGGCLALDVLVQIRDQKMT